MCKCPLAAWLLIAQGHTVDNYDALHCMLVPMDGYHRDRFGMIADVFKRNMILDEDKMLRQLLLDTLEITE